MMRLLIATAFAALATPAFALSADDYSACMIGRAAIVLHDQAVIDDYYGAIELAKPECPAPAIDAADMMALDAYVEEVVEDIAGALNLAAER